MVNHEDIKPGDVLYILSTSPERTEIHKLPVEVIATGKDETGKGIQLTDGRIVNFSAVSEYLYLETEVEEARQEQYRKTIRLHESNIKRLQREIRKITHLISSSQAES